MRLIAYLQQEKLSPAQFGRSREPHKHRSTIRQWAEGTRFPTNPLDLQWVSDATGEQVTPADFVAHAVELRAARATDSAAGALSEAG